MKIKSISKMLFLTISISTSLITSTNSIAAGIPVIDVAGLAQATATVVNLKTQIENQISQIRQAEAQFKSITGSRNLGQLFNNPALRNYLPENYANLYDAIKSGNNAQMSRALDQIAQQEKNYSSQKNGKQRYETQMLLNKATSVQALEAQSKRLDNIQSLMDQINFATDTKAAQDLANRLAVEQANIQTEQTRINLMLQLNRANLELAKQQRDQESVNSLLGTRLKN